MHASVACTSCHVKMVFTNVGQHCQDCHADIHRRQLGANCEQCHTVRGWQVAIKDVEQHNNRFPLTGAHAAVDCDACHKNGANSQFQTMSTACFSCHQSDFTSTNNPSHVKAQFSTNCETCHSTDNWLSVNVTGFDHSTTGFVLSGGHAVPPRQCSDCHVNNNYTLGALPCIGCHQADFNSASTPVPHSGFPTTCEQCHDTVQWTDGKFDHSTTGFTLTGMHTVPPRQCSDCHVNNNYTLSGAACVTCHLKDFQGTTNPNHVTSNFPQTCEQCHTTSNWTGATFNHNLTNFPLTGMHTVPPRQCTDCHVNNNYTITNTTCVSCHLTDFQGTNNPNHVTSNFPQTCEQCHDTTNWMDATFNHSTTGFALTGLHTVPPRACSDCHNSQFGGPSGYSITSGACVTCHLKDFQGTTNPNHVTSGFAQTCDICHSTAGWIPATFDHATSGFPLTGAHATTPCASCHVNNNYSITDTSCVSCHQTDFNGATSPVPHTGFPTTCQQCHDTVAWTDGKFDHSTTGFALTGLHTVPPRLCTDCHVNNNYNLTSTTCVSCHLSDFNTTTNPNHVTANFPQTCDTCHDTTNWMDATFNHSSTGFTLTGMHTVPPRACTDCHVNNNYALNSTACVTCHLKDFQGTTSPNHVTANFPQTCDTCHDTTSWLDSTFNHTSTGFTLTGAHTVPPRACTDCHVNNNYALNSTACVTCHLKDYQGTTNPNHVTANFPQTCDTCHDTTVWTDATFNHASTGFTLTGAHTTPPRLCTDCHVNNNYNLTSTACVTCHQTDYNNATTPVAHAAAGFPTTCDSCHDTVLWTDGKFDHSTTGFTLTNSHTVPPRLCTDCHVSNNYSLNSTLCYSCHSKDYAGTTNPAHASAGFPTTCETCHDTSVWTDSTFNHNNTAFPLVGTHTTTPCASCHVNSNYAGTLPTTCIGCHQTDYNGTANPPHSAAANTAFFPTTCLNCHLSTLIDWTGANFPHSTYTQFPITHGNAGGVCSTCHTTLTSLAVFQCTGCHGNNNASNFQHPNVNGYVYNSPNCYQCHASGGGG
jgi:NMD protein affecting ribosome stability and mRNA decay